MAIEETKTTEAGEQSVEEEEESSGTQASSETAAPRMCEIHPSAPAVAYCSKCCRWICATCDFAFAGDVHLCPDCAVTAGSTMSPSRAKMARWSLGLAIASTVSLVITFASSAMEQPGPSESEAVSSFVGGLSAVSSIVGFGLGMAARRRDAVNPALVKTAVSWSGAMMVIWFLLMIAGVLMS